jgi:hypothetical protein
MKYLLTVFILLNSIQTRAASFYNGSELLEYCEHYLNKTDVGLANACYGYVAGHHDAEKLFSFESINYYCIPKNISSQELITVAAEYLRTHPKDLHYSATALIFVAFTEAYPCN